MPTEAPGGPRSWAREDGYRVSTERARLDLGVVHALLAASYWSPGVARAVVERAAEHSLPFGLYAPDGRQVGYARTTTDFTTFAYLQDVVVAESERGRGLGKFLTGCVFAHPDLQGLRRWVLVTRDAHGLYAQHGFRPLEHPDRYMEKTAPAPPGRGSG